MVWEADGPQTLQETIRALRSCMHTCTHTHMHTESCKGVSQVFVYCVLDVASHGWQWLAMVVNDCNMSECQLH